MQDNTQTNTKKLSRDYIHWRKNIEILKSHTFEEKEKCYSIKSTYEIQIRMGVLEAFRLENHNCRKEKSF